MNLTAKPALLLSGIILLIGSISYYEFSGFHKDALKKETTEKLQNAAVLYLNKLDRKIYGELNDLKVIRVNPVITSRKSTPAQIQKEIEKFLNQHPQYASVSFSDMSRVKLASAGQGGNDIGVQHLWNEYWPSVYSGEDLIVDYSMSSTLNVPTIHLANTIKDDQGVALGVIVLRIPAADLIEEIIGEDPVSIDSNILKYNMTILDKNGLMLYSNHDKKAIFSKIDEDFAYIKNILPSVRSVSSLIINEVNSDEDERVGEEILIFAKEQGYREFKGNSWILKIDLPVKEAFASVNNR